MNKMFRRVGGATCFFYSDLKKNIKIGINGVRVEE